MVIRLTIRNNSQVIGDVGELETMTIFNKWGWAAEKIIQDYGEDIHSTIFIDNKKTKLYFRCQVKSTENLDKKNYVRKLKSGDFSVSISIETLKSWLNSFFPVFIVIYDVTSGDLFWQNPRDQILGSLDSRKKRKLAIRISKANSLLKDKEKIIRSVEDYYKTLTRITSSKLKCFILPVIMPEYKLVSPFDFKKYNFNELKNDIEVNFTSIISDKLPAWTTVLKSREVSNYLLGFEITSQMDSVSMFMNLLRGFIGKLEINNIQEHEWQSFIISPIVLESMNDNDEYSKKEITEWLSYSKINQEIIDDFIYTFEVSGYKNEIARRSRGWGNKFYIDDVNDISLELYSAIETTPSIRRAGEAIISHAKGQVISWMCPIEKIDLLNTKLSELNLCFRPLGEMDTSESIIHGVITNPLFDLEFGLVPTVSSWNEYDIGSVIHKLKKNNLLKDLEGCLGDNEAKMRLEKLIKENFDNDYKYTLLTEYDYFDGLPLLHNHRRIVLSRYRKMEIFDENNIDKIKEVKYQIENHLTNPINFDFEFHVIEEYSDKAIYSISVNWTPSINDSTIESLEKYKEEILRYFDMIFPREVGKKEYSDSKEVLMYEGEIIFE